MINELSEFDSALDAWIMCRYGVNSPRVPFIQNHLDSLLADNPNKAELNCLWARVKDAHRRKNMELLEERFDGFMIALKAAVYLSPLAGIGDNVKRAHENRDDFNDKQDFIKLVQELNSTLPSPPLTLKGWMNVKELDPYKRKYHGRDTLRDWINEAIPGTLKTGRPRKHTVIP